MPALLVLPALGSAAGNVQLPALSFAPAALAQIGAVALLAVPVAPVANLAQNVAATRPAVLIVALAAIAFAEVLLPAAGNFAAFLVAWPLLPVWADQPGGWTFD